MTTENLTPGTHAGPLSFNVATLFAAVQRFPGLQQEVVLRSLRELHGVGEQTASAVTLFWVGRPTPIVDTYLWCLLDGHHLLPTAFSCTNAAHRAALYQHMRQGALASKANHPEWSAVRVLSCLYLWACKIGRLGLCECKTDGSSTCPVQAMCEPHCA